MFRKRKTSLSGTKHDKPRETVGRPSMNQIPGAAPVMDEVTVMVHQPMESVVGNAGYEEVLWAQGSGPVCYKKVPYAEWRKHYAKDKQGRYRGTEEPAADCLLLPQERVEWREKLLKQAEGDEEGEVDGTQIEKAAHRKDSKSHHNDSSETVGGDLESEPAKGEEVTHAGGVGRSAKDGSLNENHTQFPLASDGSESKQKWWKRVGRRRDPADTTIR